MGLIVKFIGTEFELEPNDILNLENADYDDYCIKIKDIGVTDIHLVATGGGSEEERIVKEPKNKFLLNFNQNLVWNWIITVERDGKDIKTFHPY